MAKFIDHAIVATLFKTIRAVADAFVYSKELKVGQVIWTQVTSAESLTLFIVNADILDDFSAIFNGSKLELKCRSCSSVSCLPFKNALS
jgi:hypothetical protein